ncbi:DEAD/DEAH box helicase [Flaviflexus huanghaiensis]|uniref:DEAD/DEAH box helicase n=1 Tax=Flaviflexus huanghaiensis TaxID=1111473 RepID=UPI0015FA7143|nr:DEAD/DEAH box helicase [Flaviflexus huanghaiensis]
MSIWGAILDGFTADQVAGTHVTPARPGVRTSWPEWLHPSIPLGMGELGIPSIWKHQAEGMNAVHERMNTVIATGTGSGKSLIAWAPVLSQIAEFSTSRSLSDIRRRPTALYLAPTKALAADQLDSLDRMISATANPAQPATVDGDTPGELRRWARSHADLVLTNPDFAHFSLMAGHQRWSRLWSGLSAIIVDEFHTYRGMTGAQVALVVRRMLRIARHYGSEPIVIFLSATAADPGSTAARFLGIDRDLVAVVDTDYSAHSSSRLVIARGRPIPRNEDNRDLFVIGGSEEPPRRSAVREASEAAVRAVEAGASTLIFSRSRAGAETVSQLVQEGLVERFSPFADRVAAYRGGYLPEERRELEAGLRDGAIRALATTNALELGIDISGLDAVVMSGWPGTHASFRQQLGRAGRGGQDGIGVLIARDDPLDQYLAENADSLLGQPLEAQVFDPGNPYVISAQVCAAASELPLSAADAAVFGFNSTDHFEELVEAGLLTRRGDSWRWNVALGVSAHDMVDIRGGGAEISIIEGTTGVLLGTVSAGQADRHVHPNAIYIHQGEPFIVISLDDERAVVEPFREEEIRTFAVTESAVEIIETREERALPHGVLAFGDVLVASRVTGYDTRRSRDGLYLGRMPLDMPLRQLPTQGCWWTVSEKRCADVGLTPDILPGALHGLEHAAIGLLPLFATCDRWDIGGLSTAMHAQTASPTIIIHDAIPGGSGCAERGFRAARSWLAATVSRLESCPCREGCPSCIQSPKCGNGNSPLSKTGALLLGRALVEDMAYSGPASA